MTHSPLVPTFIGVLANQEQTLVNARELHAFIESKQQFADWMKKRIEDYGFVENQDFIRFHKKMNRENQGLTNWNLPIEYHLSLEMAKELSMVERNDKGRMARRYFIGIEQHALNRLLQREALIDDLKDAVVNQNPRWQKIFGYACKGLNSVEIAKLVGLSPRHICRILQQMRQLELMPHQQPVALPYSQLPLLEG